MSQVFEYTGMVEEVFPVQTFASGFTKRDFIVGNDVDSPSKYPNPVKFSFKKDNCSLLDSVHKGQRVKVRFAIDGRRWEGQRGVQYFIDLTAEEQSAIYARLDEQCKRYLGKNCEELLAEADKLLKEESS